MLEVKEKIKSKGYAINIPLGSLDTPISLPSEGKELIGIAFDTQFAGNFGLTVSNEVVHEKVSILFAVPMGSLGGGGLGLNPYFPVNRKINIGEPIKLVTNSSVALSVGFIVFYK